MLNIPSMSVVLHRLILRIVLPGMLCLGAPLVSWADVETLTPEERDWLKAHPVIRIGIDGSYAPYSFKDKNGDFIGVAPDILRLIEDRLGIRFEAVADLSWPEIVDGARERTLDVIATAVVTEERKDFLGFTQIYIPTPLVMMTRQDEDAINTPDDLKQRTVALVKGYSSSQRVVAEHPEVNPYWVDTPLEGLQAVAVGDADAYIGVLGINIYLSSRYGITNLQIAGPYDVQTNGQRLGVRKDWPELVSILDKTLNDIPEQDKLQILSKWIPTASPSLLSREQIIVLGIIAAGGVLLLAMVRIGLLRRQRQRLKQEVREQTRALHESERRLELALQGGGMAAWDIDFNTKKMIVSQGWWRLMGLPEDDNADPRHAWLQQVDVQDREHVLAQEAALLRGDVDRYEVEYRLYQNNGRLRWHVIRGSVVPFMDGDHAAHAVGLIEDVTERKEMDRIKTEFVSSVSHELRTPLTSIKGSLGLLANGSIGEMPEKAQELLAIAYQNSDRLNLLINDLLDIQKLQSGKVELQLEDICIKELIAKAIESNQGYADEFGSRYEWLHSESENKQVRGDEHRLLQVMANLLSNAVKFSPPGENVIISTSRVEGRVRVSVADKGPGVPDEFKQQIFERFSQVDSSDTREKSGTGLGLAISREIIDQHNGDIGVENVAGNGSAFYFELPALAECQR